MDAEQTSRASGGASSGVKNRCGHGPTAREAASLDLQRSRGRNVSPGQHRRAGGLDKGVAKGERPGTRLDGAGIVKRVTDPGRSRSGRFEELAGVKEDARAAGTGKR